MTPQIARMVATRLGREPQPIRLCYEGTIVRRRQGRARRHRQVPQAGVELYGAVAPTRPAQAGDLEVIELAASVVASLGLSGAVLDLGHASIARALLDPLPAQLAAEVSDALGQKDGARIERLLRGRPGAGVIAPLCDLHGGGPGEVSGEALLGRAAPILAGTGAEPALGELRALWTAARAVSAELASRLRIDLGEVRGFAYYTGAIFHILAPGPGEPIGAGGRYDDLLARFDAPMPAVGFALHLDAVAWAREAAGIADDAPPRAVIASPSADAARPLIAALRARGVAAVAHGPEGAVEYAAAWRFTHLVTSSGVPPRFRLRRLNVERGALDQRVETDHGDPEALARAIADDQP
jgi:ATP phosphoribosyltransferase regulatory subunit